MTRRLAALLRAAVWLLALPLLVAAVLLLDAVSAAALLAGGRRAYGRTAAAGLRGLLAVAGALTGTTLRLRHHVPVRALPPGPVIFVGNHQPPLDFVLLAMAFHERLPAYVARAGLGRWTPVCSLYLRAADALSRRGDPHPGKLACDVGVLAARALARGGSVGIFPEGHTPCGGLAQPRPFRRKGLRRLMQAMPDAPLVPVVFDGGDRLLGGRRWLPRPGQRIEMHVLAPLPRGGAGIEELIDDCERIVHRAQRANLARHAAAAWGETEVAGENVGEPAPGPAAMPAAMPAIVPTAFEQGA